MAVIARLVKGGRTLIDFTSAPYALASGFVPPSAPEIPYLSGGYHKGRGSSRVDVSADNQDWSLPISVYGSRPLAIENAIDRVNAAMELAGDEREPVFFEWQTNGPSFQPLWGQQMRRVQVEWGTTPKNSMFARNVFAGTLENVPVLMNIRPYPEGQKMRVGSATGGVFMDYIGKADRRARGVALPRATTNKATNPVFGHATPLNGWTTGAGLISAANTKKEFVLFDKNSAKVTRVGAANLQFYQTLNVGNTNDHTLSIYAKKEDGSAITSSDIQLYYNTTLTTTYTALEDGWYRLTATVAGINANTTSGVHFPTNLCTIYLDGFQVEERTYASVICYGDLLGNAWSGTAHASTSSRGASYLRVASADCLNVAEGTIRVVWRPSVASTFPSNMRIFQNGATSLRALYQASDDKIYFSDNTNTAGSTNAQSWSAYDDIVLHFTWSPASGLLIYRAGVLIGSNATYTPPTLGSLLYIGSTQVPDEQIVGTLRGFKTWGRAMSATEISNDYAEITPVIDDDQIVDHIPAFWTKDGDDILDQVDDSGRDNWGVFIGVPGDVPALTELRVHPSDTLFDAYWLARTGVDLDRPVLPTDQWYWDLSGTVDANASGGQTLATSAAAATREVSDPSSILGKLEFLVRLKTSSGTYSRISAGYSVGVDGIESELDARVIAAATTYRLFYLGDIFAALPPVVAADYQNFRIGYSVSSDGSSELDFVLAINGDLVRLFPSSTTYTYLKLNGLDCFGFDSNGMSFCAVTVRGDEILLEPNKLNYLWALSGDDNEDSGLTPTITLAATYITPRWKVQ